MRPTWDEYFTVIAREVATRSTCLRRSVGAVIVRDKRILCTGYNGAPRGLPHCEETGCLRETLGIPSGQRQEICRGLHAEQNAIIQAALHGVSVEGGTIYVTIQPCITCAKMIINSGIVRVVVQDTYPDDLSAQMLEEAGVELVVRSQTSHHRDTESTEKREEK
jgi:dCMP deaminase